MEEFLSIVFIVILVIWGIFKGIAWIFLKITESLSLTFAFIYANIGMHITVSVLILLVSLLYIFNDVEKKKNAGNQSDAKKVPSRREIPIKFTKEYYGINNSMTKIEKKEILRKEYMKYCRQQTSTSGRVIEEAEKHKRAITKLQTELFGKL